MGKSHFTRDTNFSNNQMAMIIQLLFNTNCFFSSHSDSFIDILRNRRIFCYKNHLKYGEKANKRCFVSIVPIPYFWEYPFKITKANQMPPIGSFLLFV